MSRSVLNGHRFERPLEKFEGPFLSLTRLFINTTYFVFQMSALSNLSILDLNLIRKCNGVRDGNAGGANAPQSLDLSKIRAKSQKIRAQNFRHFNNFNEILLLCY